MNWWIIPIIQKFHFQKHYKLTLPVQTWFTVDVRHYKWKNWSLAVDLEWNCSQFINCIKKSEEQVCNTSLFFTDPLLFWHTEQWINISLTPNEANAACLIYSLSGLLVLLLTYMHNKYFLIWHEHLSVAPACATDDE